MSKVTGFCNAATEECWTRCKVSPKSSLKLILSVEEKMGPWNIFLGQLLTTLQAQSSSQKTATYSRCNQIRFGLTHRFGPPADRRATLRNCRQSWSPRLPPDWRSAWLPGILCVTRAQSLSSIQKKGRSRACCECTPALFSCLYLELQPIAPLCRIATMIRQHIAVTLNSPRPCRWVSHLAPARGGGGGGAETAVWLSAHRTFRSA